MRKLSILPLVLTLLLASCAPKTNTPGSSKDNFVMYASDIITGLGKARPLISQFLPNALPKIDQGLTIATKLRDTVATSTATEIRGYLSESIRLLDDIIAHDIPQLKDESVRAGIMAALGLVDIALSLFANHAPAPVISATSRPSHDPIADFAKRPVWGKAYVH
jgi:hypothetical protein